MSERWTLVILRILGFWVTADPNLFLSPWNHAFCSPVNGMWYSEWWAVEDAALSHKHNTDTHELGVPCEGLFLSIPVDRLRVKSSSRLLWSRCWLGPPTVAEGKALHTLICVSSSPPDGPGFVSAWGHTTTVLRFLQQFWTVRSKISYVHLIEPVSLHGEETFLGNWERSAGTQFPSLCGTKGFDTVFTTALHWALYWARWVHSIPSHFTSLRFILILSAKYREPQLTGCHLRGPGSILAICPVWCFRYFLPCLHTFFQRTSTATLSTAAAPLKPRERQTGLPRPLSLPVESMTLFGTVSQLFSTWHRLSWPCSRGVKRNMAAGLGGVCLPASQDLPRVATIDRTQFVRGAPSCVQLCWWSDPSC